MRKAARNAPYGAGARGAASRVADGAANVDGFAMEEGLLHAHLRRQAAEGLSGSDLLIAERIIHRIDENGFLLVPLTEFTQEFGIPGAETERILGLIQAFNPAGVGARDLAECLALQARRADRYDSAMARLIDNLDYLGRGDLAVLRRICGVDDETLADMTRQLRGYDPRPGRSIPAAGPVDTSGQKAGRRSIGDAFSSGKVARFMGKTGDVDVALVADTFRMSRSQLAETAGLPTATLSKVDRRTGFKAQSRLRDMLEILGRAEQWAGGEAQTMAWYRSQPIPALDGRTPEALVKAGRATAVRDYLDHLALGGFA